MELHAKTRIVMDMIVQVLELVMERETVLTITIVFAKLAGLVPRAMYLFAMV